MPDSAPVAQPPYPYPPPNPAAVPQPAAPAAAAAQPQPQASSLVGSLNSLSGSHSVIQ